MDATLKQLAIAKLRSTPLEKRDELFYRRAIALDILQGISYKDYWFHYVDDIDNPDIYFMNEWVKLQQSSRRWDSERRTALERDLRAIELNTNKELFDGLNTDCGEGGSTIHLRKKILEIENKKLKQKEMEDELFNNKLELSRVELEKFKAENPPQPNSQENELSDDVMNSLLKLVLGMAIDAYRYDPNAKRNTATGENKGSIHYALKSIGLDVDADTIRKYIKLAEARFKDTLSKP